MARPKRQPTIVPPNWGPTLKAKFLLYSFSYYPSALKELAVQVRAGEITPRQWAENWVGGDTWIEPWAKETLASWDKEPPDVDGYIVYPAPSDYRAKEGFSFTITGAVPDCRLGFGMTVGGAKFGTNEPIDDWERLCDSLHRQLEYELEICRANMLRLGILQERYLGTDEDLDLKLQVAAHYLFGKKSAEEIGQHRAVLRDQSTVRRWMQEIRTLLELN